MLSIYSKVLNNRVLLVLIYILSIYNIPLKASDDERIKKIDSVYVFIPSNKINIYDPDDIQLKSAQGIEIAFSNSGFGIGYFYDYFLSNNDILFGSFYISSARNSDEYELYNVYTGRYEIPNKINRLFLIPFTFGYSRILFSNTIGGTFKPFISIGVGPSLILSNPYKISWFEAWKKHQSYLKFGTFAEIGAYFRSGGKSVSNVGIKYYFIPFGEPGLESIIDSPIKNFGGLVLSLKIGFGS